MNQEHIGKFIRKCRKERNLTQIELAERLGVSDRSVSNWECGKCMPDLSLFQPLCEELGITINELLSGEKLKKEEYLKKSEENMLHTIDYTNSLLKKNNNSLGSVLFFFGLLIILTAISIFPPDSSWSSIYAILGSMISLIGVSKFTKKYSFFKRIFFHLSYFLCLMILLFILDYVSVIFNQQAPRFSYYKETGDQVILYQAPFYQVYRINYDTKNEYYIIDSKNEYTDDTVPLSPFNRSKSGISNLINYKSSYLGDNSNTSALIDHLPLSEYGFVLEIDSENLSLTIDYQITDWYINENYYLEKSLLYNSVSIFLLVDNVEIIHFNFSGVFYSITRTKVETLYPNYDKIKDKKLSEDKLNLYVEEKMNDELFVTLTFRNLFQ